MYSAKHWLSAIKASLAIYRFVAVNMPGRKAILNQVHQTPQCHYLHMRSQPRSTKCEQILNCVSIGEMRLPTINGNVPQWCIQAVLAFDDTPCELSPHQYPCLGVTS